MSSPGNLKQNLLLAFGVCAFVHLFLSRSVLVFLPAFAAVLYILWKKGGGRMQGFEEDDPADWWKKGQKSGEQ